MWVLFHSVEQKGVIDVMNFKPNFMIFDSLRQDRSHSVILILVWCNSYMIIPASCENVSFYLKKQLSKWRELRVVLSHP